MTFNEQYWLEAIRKIIVSTLSYGRCFVTLDQNNNLVIYDALDCTNWHEGEYVTFLETKNGAEESNEYTDTKEFVRISFSNGTTYYERFDSEATLLERKSSTKFKSLPVMCVGATDLKFDVDVIPLEGIANCSLHIYKKTADLSYSEFSSCVPTMVATGVDEDSENKSIGGGVMLSIANEMAKVYYTTTDSNALQHVKLHIDGLFDEAKGYGASLLGGDKTEVESAEAIRLRQGASGASLTTLTRTVERAVNQLLALAMIDKRFSINFNLEENYMTPAEQSTLLDSWMNNAISYSTYFNNMQKAGLIDDKKEINTELSEIKTEKEEKKKDAEEAFAMNAKYSKKDESSAGRSKNLNREGSDYDTNK